MDQPVAPWKPKANQATVTVDGKTFYFRDVGGADWFLQARQRCNFASRRERGLPPDNHADRERCGITGEDLKAEDGVYIVISNPDPPNRSVSARLVDEIGYEEAAKRLVARYAEARAALAKHGDWL